MDERVPRARVVDLTIESGGPDKSFVGDAVVGSGDDAVHRRLEGQTCEAIVDAMLLVLALDRPTDSAGAAPTTTTGAEVKPARSAPFEASAAERDRAASAPAVDSRSSVEIALGTSAIARQLDFRTVLGSKLFVEVAAPASLAPWYRPSARFGLQHVSEFEWGDDSAPEARLWGAGLDLCPLGVAAVSSRHLDVTFSACGVSNFGSVTVYESRFWIDAGALGRANVQIGRKGHFRGFVGVDGGILRRLDAPPDRPASPSSLWDPLAITVPRNNAMWTFALSGGVLFP
jgi:hypothetical protein